MSPTEKLGRDQVFHLLRSPVRRGLIRVLGEKDQMSFTELRRTFPDISIGTLYYHLDLLGQIIAQNSVKKYMLTEEGRRVYQEILRSEEVLLPVKASVESRSSLDAAPTYLPMTKTLAEISLRPLKFVSLPFLIFLLTAFAAWISHSVEILYFFVPVNSLPPTLIALAALASILGAYALLNGFTILFFHRREGNLALLIATSLGFVPLVIYPALLFIASFTVGLASVARSPISLAVTLAGQILSILLISVGLSQTKGLRLERSILVALTSTYLNMIMLYLLGYIQI